MPGGWSRSRVPVTVRRDRDARGPARAPAVGPRRGAARPGSLGPYTTFVAWATPLELDPVVPAGRGGGGNGRSWGRSFGKYLVWISAEASADVTEREGPLVLRGRSPSSFMEAHDLLALAPAAEEAGAPGGGAPGDAGGGARGTEPEDSADAARGSAGRRHAAHDGRRRHPTPDGPCPPAIEGVEMLPGMMELSPTWRRSTYGRPDEPARLPWCGRARSSASRRGHARPDAGFVRKQVAGRRSRCWRSTGSIRGR
jgi:hypothetical protein